MIPALRCAMPKLLRLRPPSFQLCAPLSPAASADADRRRRSHRDRLLCRLTRQALAEGAIVEARQVGPAHAHLDDTPRLLLARAGLRILDAILVAGSGE